MFTSIVNKTKSDIKVYLDCVDANNQYSVKQMESISVPELIEIETGSGSDLNITCEPTQNIFIGVWPAIATTGAPDSWTITQPQTHKPTDTIQLKNYQIEYKLNGQGKLYAIIITDTQNQIEKIIIMSFIIILLLIIFYIFFNAI